MSSYLTFYVVPKKNEKLKDEWERGIESMTPDKPLALLIYSRANPVYQAYYEELNPPYIENENPYMKVTYNMSLQVRDSVASEISRQEERLETLYKMMKNGGDVYSDIMSAEEYIKELKDTKDECNHICSMIYDIDELQCTDFECVMINVD